MSNKHCDDSIEITESCKECRLFLWVGTTGFSELLNLFSEQSNCTASIFYNFTEEKVKTLNCGCALIQSINLGIADVLLERHILRCCAPVGV